MSPRALLTASLMLSLAACSGSERQRPSNNNSSNNNSSNNNTSNNNNVGNQRPCGNGVLNGQEVCDGSAFSNGETCAGYGLGDGTVLCTASCQLNFGGCSLTDYCTANSLYDNGACDPCELLGGVRDPDCDTVCGEDGTCADRYEPLVGQWTCRRLGLTDPDCGMCGNGIIEGNEVCDRQALPPDRFRCDAWGYLPGADITCNADCSPNFGACSYSRCGDGVREGMEVCDSGDLQGQTCESLGFAGGTLGCSASCAFDDSACIAPGCGNGIVEQGLGEACEAGAAVPTCEDLGFAGGTTSCDGACQVDTSGCVNPGCGNGIIEAPLEECEGGNLNGASCQSLGFLQGNLACSGSSCTYDTSGCVPAGCGNQIIESGEDCEGNDLNGASCETLGYLQGQLGCSNTTCTYDTSACVSPGCGNQLIEAGEACDGANLQNQTCQTLGYGGGNLGCDSSCLFDASGCSGARNTCGDGVAQGTELCDGSSFAFFVASSCSNFGFPGGGNISCTTSCELDFSTCQIWTDLCDYYSLYGDGAVCHPCEFYTPVADPDTDCTGCGADGTCVDAWITGEYACVRSGFGHDPDCGCGNGTLDPARADGSVYEMCEGNQFVNDLSACTDWGFAGGVMGCTTGCDLDFSNCL